MDRVHYTLLAVLVAVLALVAVPCEGRKSNEEIAKEAMQVMTSVPFAPPNCYMAAEVTQCTAFGLSFECLGAFRVGGIFYSGVNTAHIFTLFLHVAVAVFSASKINWARVRAGQDTAQVVTTLYVVSSLAFMAVRAFWQAGRLYVMVGTMHNLCEWLILCLVCVRKIGDRSKFIIGAASLTFTLVFFVGLFPVLFLALFLEAPFGLCVDFTIPIVFFLKMRELEHTRHAKFFRLGLVAALTHLIFVVVPSIYTSFYSMFDTWMNAFVMEIAICTASPLCHLIYHFWAIEYDAILAGDDGKKSDEIGISATASPKTTYNLVRRRSTAMDGPADGPLATQPTEIPRWMYFSSLKKALVVGFVLGMIPSMIVPAVILPPCPDTICVPSVEVFTTTEVLLKPDSAAAFEALANQHRLVEAGNMANGNIRYELIKDAQNPDRYEISDHWQTAATLDAWLASTPKAFFANANVTALLQDGQPQPAKRFTPTPTCTKA